METIIKKLKNNEELSENEIKELVWEGRFVDEVEGDDHRWQKEIQTIVDIDGQLYAIDWMRGLTECQENEFLEQPYKVERVEEVVTTIKVTYKRSEGVKAK